MDVKERIVVAAIELMSDDGVKSTTMDHIAQHIGISKRTIYENFKDKTEVVRAVSMAFIDHAQKKLDQVSDCAKNVITELFILIDEINKDFALKDRISREIKRYYPDIFEELYVAHNKRSFEILVQGLQRGKDQGFIIENTNLQLAAYVMIESVKSLMNNPDKLMEVTRESKLETFKFVVVNFFRGISTTKGIQMIDEHLDKEKL